MTKHVDRLHPRIQAVDPQSGLLTPFFFKWLVQVFERIGGPDDAIADVEQGELYEPGITDSHLTNTQTSLVGLQNEFDSLTNARITELENQLFNLQKEIDTFSDSKVAALENELFALQNELDMSPIWNSIVLNEFQIITTSTAYTSVAKQIIFVTSNVTITLNTNPKDGEIVIIKRVTTAGSVTIDGGTIGIDGASTYVLLVNYEAAQCIYSSTNDEWLII